jgi:YegS/Rv2252/BmrU family lipid kinase
MSAYLAIVNPAAGGGRGALLSAPAIESIRAEGIAVDVFETEGPGDATDKVREAFRDGRRQFLSVGGDGTTFEVINGLFPEALDEPERPTLAILPLGTGNSFLRDFTTRGAEGTLDALKRGERQTVDVIRLEHTEGVIFFINLVSLGFVADVGDVTNRWFKRLGESGYILGVLSQLLQLRPQPIPFRVDEGPLETMPLTFLAACNSQYTGGKMHMAPDANAGDGRIDLILVGSMGRLSLIGTFPKIFHGTHLNHPATDARRATRLDFELDGPAAVMVDGEVLTLQPTRLNVLPGALDICIGE